MKTNLFLEKQLADWAYWITRFEKGLEGYPKRSLVSVLMEVGIFSRGYPSSSIPYQSGKEEKMNCLINQMGVDHPEYKEAIKAYYLRRNITLSMAAKELNISLALLKYRVNRAKEYLSQYLSDDKLENDKNINLTSLSFFG